MFKLLLYTYLSVVLYVCNIHIATVIDDIFAIICTLWYNKIITRATSRCDSPNKIMLFVPTVFLIFTLNVSYINTWVHRILFNTKSTRFPRAFSKYNLGDHVMKSIVAWQTHVKFGLLVEHWCLKDARSVSFRSELFTSYILTIFTQWNLLP